MARKGQRALSEGDARRTVPVLRAALALWRGPALADVADRARTVFHRDLECDLPPDGLHRAEAAPRPGSRWTPFWCAPRCPALHSVLSARRRPVLRFTGWERTAACGSARVGETLRGHAFRPAGPSSSLI
ncbi:BTAD domain-containing putative transcriptional regulator [Streptomyces bungoensis]